MHSLLADALHAGLGVREYWELTPAETLGVLDAHAWRLEREREARAWAVWHTAALVRAKKLPALKRLVDGYKTVQLRGVALEDKRREHAEIMAAAEAKRAGN